ncbi:phosphate signaling complex protein PhoU [Cobetia sp. cqz5-12]|jgi:phosphate transport system protein|uniref:Phosphate-specific transport system accessory protein PhoU n=1 Tax=Cobetia amphilecti TaxID=1055104 RepID=A0AAP4TY15_9GAMM|nr:MULTISPECIES: phosphate signaling complex protein PhoU [Cobetia]AVV34179.1 phosphate transport system regulatory protein PhoU [Halomonas sp. SF2003]MBR9755158.1 phosphate signaling complex protein PhoU [Gammaproteobacteria bacterium]TCJ24461.1 phosphate signaling complex protein PhoU [Halomonas sp. GDM18]KGA03235.1 transcriptional regulator PhoU [Cobetia amphilecti]KPM78240.1 transcriptional regulator PhoU [Cobetia sp. UCD-24C]|tara:strand:+ start:26820 stop:27545 length:726 start_codon:yes stop_codon:yes gene_type:complete
MDITSDSHGKHISEQFNHELDALKTHLLAMGGLVEKQLQDAVTALLEGDSETATRVRDNDKAVNDMQLKIDDECTRVLARRQPAASDLRLVLAVIRATSDLERIGDESSKIARNAISLVENGQSPRGMVEVRHLSQHVRSMVRDSLTAFARFDTDLALKVLREDASVDLEYQSAMRSLMTFMMEDARQITPVLNVMWILRALERIGDHADNLAEYVIFLVKGVDVRHTDTHDLKPQDLDKK